MKKNNLFNKIKKFNFVKNLKYFIALPILLVVIGIILMFTVGFNLGIDFTGGTILNVIVGDTLQQDAVYQDSMDKIDNVLYGHGLKASMYQQTETEYGWAISVRYQDKKGYSEEEMNSITEEIKEELYVAFSIDKENEEFAHVQDGQRIGATASTELLTNAFLSVLVVIAVILIYIALRFEFTSGMAAILALFHDVIMMCVFVLIFRIEINSSYIAAIITIIGYSINNTILVFDKIREYLKNENYSKYNNEYIANNAIKTTLTRSIYTTLTTMVTIATIAILGVPSIQQFALPIIFGLVAGAYSSVCLAPGLWAMAYYKRKKPKTVVIEEQVEFNK